MTYNEIAKLAEELSYRDKFRLAQLLIQLGRKEEEEQYPDARKAAAQQVEGAKNYIDSVRKTPFGIAELTANVFDRIQKAYEISGLNK